ncbi:Uu.00g079960.m01.CDS01 [Anthostomella pinea]|uniref:DNA ligase n=1 Tax=Anthostomella pinea TaxID=933095 RepID=A0AAI8YJ95_9PEZI|nr:Uu.00g079960.m01.CDS01 [Anthostomella pinea]
MSQRAHKTRDPGAVDEEERQYITGGQTLAELDDKYPNRPKNHSRTLFFSALYKNLFDPLNDSKKQPSRSSAARSRAGPRGTSKLSPQEHRRNIIESFISRWRSEVGDDFFPALRLILPASDRERGMYGLKENAIARLLVKLLKIDRNSDDAYSILHWKSPARGQSAASQAGAGDFPARCYEVLSRRPILIEPGDMRVADVNEMLDRLSAASGEKEQLPIFEIFYQRMNAEELQWLIRIILRQLKVGATEKTILELWHPDGQDLFGVSSSLRRVCWELYDPRFRLTSAQTGVNLMQCFQPQLAWYQMAVSFQKMIEKLNASTRTGDDADNEYWIEEKMDGERMQLHMVEDDSIPGGKRFCFWSRNVKNYTYLYGESLYEQDSSSLTRHLKNAFAPGVRNIILDGEMLVWDPVIDKVLKFGTLKTAALQALRNPHKDDAPRPVFRAFDIVYLNDQPLTHYTLRDRRNALAKAVPGEPGRLEILDYIEATSPDAIEPMLRKIVSDASEGVVIKNPRSSYHVDDRNSDWIKVKPDYLSGFGEEVDVVVIGGYYGSGHRGGRLSSFLCGLRVTEDDVKAGADPEKCYSFIKVGGGFRAEDFAEIQHLTQGKWRDWNPKKPPSKYIQLAGGDKHQYERPDVWIRPSESIVITVKAASLEESDSFASKFTLRFPRFKWIRHDRDFRTALDYQQFENIRLKARDKKEERAMEMETKRRRTTKRARRAVVIAGQDAAPIEFAGPRTKVFEGLEFCVLTDCTAPIRRSKTQLEAMIKENGGKVSQRASPGTDMILVADKKVVKVASLIKAGEVDMIRPKWLLDCLAQSDKNFLLPYEPGHIFHAVEATNEAASENIDEFGDSYARDLDVKELRQLLRDMPKKETFDEPFNKDNFLAQLEGHGHDMGSLRSHLFRGMKMHLVGANDGAPVLALKLRNWIKFGGGVVVDDLDDNSITNVVVLSKDETSEMERAAEVRSIISRRHSVPRVVSQQWVEDCWKNRTVVDEERYAPL